MEGVFSLFIILYFVKKIKLSNKYTHLKIKVNELKEFMSRISGK